MPIAKKTLSPKATMIWIVVLTGIGGLMAALDTLAVSTAVPALRSAIAMDAGAPTPRGSRCSRSRLLRARWPRMRAP